MLQISATIESMFRLGEPIVQMHNSFRLPFLFHKNRQLTILAAFFVVEIEGLAFEQSENPDVVRHISFSRHDSYKPVAEYIEN